MATEAHTLTTIVVGSRQHCVRATPEAVLAMLEEDDSLWLRFNNQFGDAIWVRRDLISAFVEGGGNF